MSNQLHHPGKQGFQVERLIFFSDAVFAIAITILVIELKVPIVPENATEQDFVIEFAKQSPQIIGFILSFFLIGIYWTGHHNIFGYVINYSKKLLWINLIYLLTIVIMPFTTAIYSAYSLTEGHLKLITPYAIYVFNICFTGMISFILLSYITNPKNKISEFVPDQYTKFAKVRSLIAPGVFLLSLLVCLFDPGVGRMVLFLLPFTMAYVGRKMRRQLINLPEKQTRKKNKH